MARNIFDVILEIQKLVAALVEEKVISAYVWALTRHVTGKMEDITPEKMAFLYRLYVKMSSSVTSDALSNMMWPLATRSSDDMRAWLHDSFTFRGEEMDSFLYTSDMREWDYFFNAVDTNRKYDLVFKAASSCNDALILWLIGGGVDVNTKNSDGLTPLHIAAGENNPDVVKFLLKQGADCYALDSIGEVPFDKALNQRFFGENEVLELLLPDVFADKALPHRINSRFHQAAFEGDALKLRYLLGKVSDVNIRNKCGFTALHLAALRGYPDAVKILLEYEADVNAKWSFKVGFKAFKNLAIDRIGLTDDNETEQEHGYFVNAIQLFEKECATTKENLTPLRMAEIFKFEIVVNILVAVGAN